ncbi:Subtilase family protein [Halogranum amylolyticum]|uniref:Subtilase family protein n=1 Tax=Halogranum amylolyticum TaxID=660520 RepID=A0A1H8PE74_9EURY|nr:S8 family serine peptidase [Halogranum amylolyticum]SEO39984.1 Subtilase family protein [Halogranum amylolyticum]
MNLNRRNFVKGVAGAGLSLSVVGTVSAAPGDRFVVTGESNVAQKIERAGYDVVTELAGGRVVVVEGDEGVADVDGVKAAVPDLRLVLDGPVQQAAAETTDEELYDLQWDKQTTSVPEAHETATGAGSSIAVIDTGVDVDHPDLEPNLNLAASRLFRGGEVLDGEDEVVLPSGERATRHVVDDVSGHGSHVSGIAAGSNDGTTGIAGTAPDAELVGLRVFYYATYENADGEEVFGMVTTTADILAAIDYAASIGVDAMNMSIGTPPQPPQNNSEGYRVAYRTVIGDANNRGSVVVVSAGNASADLQHGGTFTTPNSVSGAMSVSATGPNDELVFYSNYGTNEIAVGAPGGGYETLEKTLDTDADGDGDPAWPFPTNLVLSSVPPELYEGDAYAYFAGTSMAAPQVTGVAALVREAAPDTTVKQVERAIQQGATGANGQGSTDVGAGVLDAAGALDSL